MDKISQEEFDKARALVPEKIPDKEVTVEEFGQMLKDMSNPSFAQKELAVKVKIFMDKRIKDEMEKNGYLGENTRKWIETYNNILEKLQKVLHGDKSVSLHLHKISHGEIAAKIRESITVLEK